METLDETISRIACGVFRGHPGTTSGGVNETSGRANGTTSGGVNETSPRVNGTTSGGGTYSPLEGDHIEFF